MAGRPRLARSHAVQRTRYFVAAGTLSDGAGLMTAEVDRLVSITALIRIRPAPPPPPAPPGSLVCVPVATVPSPALVPSAAPAPPWPPPVLAVPPAAGALPNCPD